MTRHALRFGRAAALASTIALASCDAQMLIGTMSATGTTDDSGTVSTSPKADVGAGNEPDASPPSPTSDASVPMDDIGDARPAADMIGIPDLSADGAPPGDAAPPDDSAPPDDIAPPDDVAPPMDVTISDVTLGDGAPPDSPRPDGATCPSSARAPVVCVPPASAQAAPIEECLTASRTLYQENRLLLMSSLKADAAGVYWVSNDNGLRVLRQGATAPQLLGFVGRHAFAIDPDALYFTTEHDAGRVEIRKIKRDGTGLTLIASDVNSTTEIALGGDRVYFNPEGNSLASAPKAGNGAIQTIVAGRIVWNVVADATHVYWLEFSSETATDRSAIWRAPHGSTATERVATDLSLRTMWEQGDGLILLFDELIPSRSDYVASYFLEVPKAGGCPRVLVSLPRSRYSCNITTVAIDGQSIYWAAQEPDTKKSSIWYAPRTGGIAVKVSDALSNENVALTPTQVFWGDTIPTLTTFDTLIQVMDRP